VLRFWPSTLSLIFAAPGHSNVSAAALLAYFISFFYLWLWIHYRELHGVFMLYMSVPVFLLYTPYNCSASIVFIEIYMQPLLHSFSLTNSFDVAWNTIIQFWYEDDDIHTSRTPSSDFPYPKNYWRSEL